MFFGQLKCPEVIVVPMSEQAANSLRMQFKPMVLINYKLAYNGQESYLPGFRECYVRIRKSVKLMRDRFHGINTDGAVYRDVHSGRAESIVSNPLQIQEILQSSSFSSPAEVSSCLPGGLLLHLHTSPSYTWIPCAPIGRLFCHYLNNPRLLGEKGVRAARHPIFHTINHRLPSHRGTKP